METVAKQINKHILLNGQQSISQIMLHFANALETPISNIILHFILGHKYTYAEMHLNTPHFSDFFHLNNIETLSPKYLDMHFLKK